MSLTPKQDGFIEEMSNAGEYSTASEAMRDALRTLQERRAEEALKLENLRRNIDEGLADLENGNYEEVDEAELDAWMDRVSEPGRP